MACNPSLVGVWQATEPMDVVDLPATVLQPIALRLLRRTDVAATPCERVTGGIEGDGDDGVRYIGSVRDSAPNTAGPVRLVVDMQNAFTGRGGRFISAFTGTFADSSTFRGTFNLGPPTAPRSSRVVEFRKVTTP